MKSYNGCDDEKFDKILVKEFFEDVEQKVHILNYYIDLLCKSDPVTRSNLKDEYRVIIHGLKGSALAVNMPQVAKLLSGLEDKLNTDCSNYFKTNSIKYINSLDRFVELSVYGDQKQAQKVISLVI